MIVTTTDSVEGRRVKEYLGVCSGEAIVGTNIFKDMFAGIRDVVGGRAGSYEKTLHEAKDLAIKDMAEQAASWGASAIIAVDLDYQVLGKENGMLMVAANGTAVILE